MTAPVGQLAVDEYGNPFIILEDSTGLRGLRSSPVSMYFVDFHRFRRPAKCGSQQLGPAL